ncbi:polysaccharide deacetylase family protein [Lachnobacterium bovis]|uniref:polysaccharide deacetylase family protein n=1 Tax=Lachnobacterium bovis TaxID=140626 RepID=UPI0003B33407|nr:polysaccharide deacetylase family protein [Lachnobacterium bovis]
MEEKGENVNEARNRRRRINKIKNTIVISIIVWMVLSFIGLVCLSIFVVRLNKDIKFLSKQLEQRSYNGVGVQKDNLNKVYLTFEGGPSENTQRLLDVLKEQNVKATFFVDGNESVQAKNIYKRIVDEGHTLGMRSYTNKLNQVYNSKETFEQDFFHLQKLLYNNTGVKCKYYRFLGSSNNRISNVSMSVFVDFLKKHNITYVDWNVTEILSLNSEDRIQKMEQEIAKNKISVVLLHDGIVESTTVENLGRLINDLKKSKSQILPIDKDANVIQFFNSSSIE